MKHSFLFLMLLGVLPVLMGQSYQNGFYFHKIELTAKQPKQPLPLPQLPKPGGLIVKGASMAVRFFSKSGLAFEDNVTYNLPLSVEYSAGTSLKDTIALSIDQDHPLMVYKMDISALLANTKIDFRALQFPNPKPLANVNPVAWDKFIRNLVVEISYQIEVGIDARQFPADSIGLTIKGKKATFKWSTRGQRFPSYEFQLLKLFNDGKEITDEWDTIKIGSLDWSKALNIWTESSANSLTLTLAEGTGFYVCRVRPIGNYFDHQIANPLNYGQWSPVPLEPGLKRSKLKLPYFFFSDPDETKNYIYSRTFTEENKVNESIVFADNLLQVKQTQTFLPSKDTILVTQKIPDFSGRPAIGTLPIPVPNAEGMVYQNKFVRSNGTDLFHPRNFDTDLTLYAPDTVTSYKSPTAYYSERNPDTSIPSAEGYPYSRTIYYNEPELRVKDQSGVGKTHMIASTQADGMGHTVKTQFGVPAEEELVRIFGNEAPRASAVIKTITTDQNNISQVQYTNLSGKVIATALSIADTTQTHLKQLNHDKAIPFRVKDEITLNHHGDRGVESSKRFILQRSSDLRISYIYDCSVLRDKCTDYNVNCAFDLKISLVNIEDPSFKAIVIKRNLTDSCLIPNNQVTPVDTLLKFLPPGTYVINKELVPGKKTSVIATEARYRIEQQIKPLSNLISNWLSSVVCAKQLDEFYQKLDTLSKDVKQLDAATFRVKYQLPDSFVMEAAHSVTVLRQPATGKPETVLITSPCCQIEVSVVFVPPFRCPDDLSIINKNEKETIDVNFDYFAHPEKSEFPADFEGYAFSYLRSKRCFDEDNDGFGDSLKIDEFLYGSQKLPIKTGLLQGYNPGDFNWMVYHMLADKYNANGKLYTENPPNAKPCNTTAGGANPASDCDSNGLGGADFCCEDSLCTQYRCADLFTCWKGLLDQVVYEYCQRGTQYDNINISHEVDVHEDQEDTADKDEGNTHNEQFDKRETNIFQEFAFWVSNVWGKVRDAQKEGKPEMKERLTPKRHLAKQFLECTGYRFAKIITAEDALPTSELNDPNSLIRKYKRNSWSGFDNQGPNICLTCNTKLFPYIKDPVYAFKYFEYPKDTFPILEFTNCFEDPNICGKDAQGRPIYCCPTEKDSLCNFCGFGKIKCESTYREWSSGQRYSFYLAIEHYINDQDNTATPTPQPKSCNDYTAINPKTGKMYIDSILTEMTDAGIKACEMKRSIFSRVLRDTLLKKCYVIGECRSNKPEDDYIIPEKDFEGMVDAIIEQCKQQSVINTYKCDTSEQCRYITAPRNIIGYPAGNPTVALQYTSMRLGVGGLPCDQCTEIDSSGIFHCTADTLSYVDLLEYRQAKEWQLELIIPSKCKNATNVPLASGTPVDCEIKSEKVSVYSPYAKPKESKGLASELIPIHVEVKNKQLP